MRQLNLLYHRVNQLEPDPWTLCVSPAHFAEHLQIIRRLSPLPVLTFDDGYEDNLSNALPLLERYDTEAHFFITSGAIGRETEMWWDALDRLCPEEETYDREFRRLRLMRVEEQEQALQLMFAAQSLSQQPRPGRRMMTEPELVSFAASPLVRLGAHTVTHPVLSQLSTSDQEKEIKGSKQQLEDMVGFRIESFSYPNGCSADYTTDTVDLVRQAGFDYAFSAFQHSNPDKFQLPRVMIRDWNGDDFERHLHEQAGKD